MPLRFAWLIFSVMISGLGMGCQVPAYQLPGGFSSTYYRYLHAQEFSPIVIEPSAVGDQPSALASPGVFYPQTFNYDPPTKSEFQQTVLLPENRPAGPRRY
jgi:hypothetical protein